MGELERIQKKPINIGGEHSIGFIIPKKWVDKLGLTTDNEATLSYEENPKRIVILP
jgi:hypothetical protein